MAEVKLITQAEYAKHRGCSAVAVHKAVKAKRISLIDGLIDPTVADIQWAQNSRARIGSKPAPAEVAVEASTRVDTPDLLSEPPAPTTPRAEPTPPDDYTMWRGRREAADAELAELRLAEQRRDLISVAAVEGVWSAMLASAREHLLQVRARLAPLLAAESDVFKIEQMLDAEHRKALETLASAEVRKLEPGQ
jgi:hypothetical protein